MQIHLQALLILFAKTVACGQLDSVEDFDGLMLELECLVKTFCVNVLHLVDFLAQRIQFSLRENLHIQNIIIFPKNEQTRSKMPSISSGYTPKRLQSASYRSQ
jgi:hypothetical protein